MATLQTIHAQTEHLTDIFWELEHDTDYIDNPAAIEQYIEDITNATATLLASLRRANADATKRIRRTTTTTT